MIQRTITGIIFAAVLIGGILFNYYTFLLLFSVITLLGLWEFYTLAEKTHHHPQKFIGLLLSALLIASIQLFFNTSYKHWSTVPVVLFIAIIFSLFIFELYRKRGNPFGNIAYTILGVLYIALPIALLSTFSPLKVLGILFILWTSDTGAYFSGMAFGKHKLFERISPKKTWEGAIGGGILGLGMAYLLSTYNKELNLTDWMGTALIILVAGNLGDLTESLFKRSIDIKDSGTILPGHGGILDRFDSLILATPFIFTYLQLRNL